MNVNDNHFYCIRPAEFHCLHFCPHFYKAFKNNITIESAEIIGDRRYNIPVVDLRFDGWYENSVFAFGQSILNKEKISYYLKELS